MYVPASHSFPCTYLTHTHASTFKKNTQTATYLVAIFYIPLAVCSVGNAISQIADYYVRAFISVHTCVLKF